MIEKKIMMKQLFREITCTIKFGCSNTAKSRVYFIYVDVDESELTELF